MKGLFAFAVIVLASSAAQAQYTFDYGGRTIRIDPDRGTVSIPGVYDNSGPRSRRSHNDQDVDRPRKQPSQQTKIDPQTPDAGVARTEQAPAPVTPSPEPSAATANVVPADPSTSTPASSQARRRRKSSRTLPPPPRRHRRLSLQQRRRSRHPLRRPRSSISHLAARPLADRRERGQGPDRALRPQSLRVFRRRQVQPEWRTGPDQYEARQGLQMAWTYSRPENRQQL